MIMSGYQDDVLAEIAAPSYRNDRLSVAEVATVAVAGSTTLKLPLTKEKGISPAPLSQLAGRPESRNGAAEIMCAPQQGLAASWRRSGDLIQVFHEKLGI